jgi:hypothetical protein
LAYRKQQGEERGNGREKMVEEKGEHGEGNVVQK